MVPSAFASREDSWGTVLGHKYQVALWGFKLMAVAQEMRCALVKIITRVRASPYIHSNVCLHECRVVNKDTPEKFLVRHLLSPGNLLDWE